MALELSENMKDWPNDPFALLGVKRGDDDFTIRKAYTQLIRRFKPEQFPEQFAKIRAAYETCKSQGQWYRNIVIERGDDEEQTDQPADETVQTDENKPLSTSHESNCEETTASDGPKWDGRPSLSIQIPEPVQNPDDLLWAKAVDGNPADAYSGLVLRSKEYGDDVDRSLRLYWLLTIDTSLDPNRTRHVWLHKALTQSRFEHRCVELYRRELLIDPSACLDEPYLDLMETEVPWTQLVKVCRMRFAAAAKSKKYAHVQNDLMRVNKVRGVDYEVDWLSLLASAYEWIAWEDTDLLRGFFPDIMKTCRSLELRHSQVFDQIERTWHISERGKVFTRAELIPFVRLIQSIWAKQSQVNQCEWIAGLKNIAESPHHALEWFDDYFSQCGSECTLILLQMLMPHARMWETDIPLDQIRAYIHRAIKIGKKARLMSRDSLLDLLIKDGVNPYKVIEACSVDKDQDVQEIAGILQGDFSFFAVWMAAMICPLAREQQPQRLAV